MKKSIKIYRLLLVMSVFAGLVTSADAQRGYRGNHSSYYRGGSYYRTPVRNYGSFYYGHPYYSRPRAGISINFGGNPYYYSGGAFYRPYGGYYRTVFPPIGIRVGILPFGYVPLYVGPDLFYFHNGNYYRRYSDREYEVVDAPMGAQLSSLPKGAGSVVVNGEKFYELNGTYYKEDRNAKGQTVYTVVGKNGEIDNTDTPAPLASVPQVGDKVNQLPDNCKSIILNGQKMFVSPDNTYYQSNADGGYTIVGIQETPNQ